MTPASIWTRIATYLLELAPTQTLSAWMDGWRTPPEHSIAFTIAVIALGAKMAKADGHVSRNEIAVFRQIFHIDEADEAQAAKVYNLARQDIAGFELYARQIAGMFADRPAMLEDLMDCLFQIATADGVYHASEDDFIHKVADIFALDAGVFYRMRRRYTGDGALRLSSYDDACFALGVEADADLADIRAAWVGIVKENHPDRLVAKGLPKEAMILANNRLVQANKAWRMVNGEL